MTREHDPRLPEKCETARTNHELALTTDQSCLNRWMTAVPWPEPQLNTQRLDWLQQDPSTRYRPHGVIALDNVLVDHAGQHYPLEFRRFIKREQCQARGVEFKDHNVLFRELVE